MFDWKIVLTILIVLAFLGFFVSSSPSVSGFFSQIGNRIGLFGLSIGIDWSEKGGNEFALTLSQYDRLQFDAVKSSLEIKGSADARIDRGAILLGDPKITGFSGSGSLSSSEISLRGSAESIVSGGSQLKGTLLDLTSSPESFSADKISIKELSFLNGKGQLILNGSITNFDGKINIKGVSASLYLEKGMLHLEGSAKSIQVPGAGIKLG